MIDTHVTPSISIILPTYNVGAFIERCLRSCLAQTNDNFEIIIVDDCGTDNSIQIAKEWAEKDERIRIIHNPRNLGTYHARRVGVEHAKADYIIFVDPDDSIEPDTVEKLTAIAALHRPDIIFFGVGIMTDRFLLRKRYSLPAAHAVTNQGVCSSILERSSMNYGTPGKAYAKKCALAALELLKVPDSMRLVYAEDVLFFISCVMNAHKSCAERSLLYRYYENPGSATQRSSPSAILANIDQIDIVLQWLNDLQKEKLHFLPNPPQKNLITLISKRLNGDKAFIARHLHGAKHYATSVLASLRYNFRLGTLFRLAVFTLSMSKIRL